MNEIEYFGMFYIIGNQLYLLVFVLGIVYIYSQQQTIVSKYTVTRNTVLTIGYSIYFLVYCNREVDYIMMGLSILILIIFFALDAFDRWINRLVLLLLISDAKIFREDRSNNLSTNPSSA